ncbi:MAG TPA: tetratricopeptide repeat protein, partial [Candidatus Eisenbacteria bacterium]|nr:tetratricopeptide repeat protein [Candidatus Eisenbacteria bacterium]
MALVLAAVAAPAPPDTASGRYVSEEAVRHYLDGRWLEQGGSLQQALAEYYRALSLAPGDRDVLLRVAEVSAHLGQPERTLEFARRVAARDPGDARALWLEGAALFNLGRPAESLAPLVRACDADSGNADYLRTLARVAETLDSTRIADVAYRRLTLADGEDGEAWFQLAASSAREGRFADADSALRTANDLNPGRPGAAFLQGWIAENLGHGDEAIQAYDEHLKQHPEDVVTRRRLVGLLAQAGRAGDAYAQARQVSAAQPRDPEALQVEADLAFAAGEAAAGERALARLRALDPGDPDGVERSAFVLGRHQRGAEGTRLAVAWAAA